MAVIWILICFLIPRSRGIVIPALGMREIVVWNISVRLRIPRSVSILEVLSLLITFYVPSLNRIYNCRQVHNKTPKYLGTENYQIFNVFCYSFSSLLYTNKIIMAVIIEPKIATQRATFTFFHSFIFNSDSMLIKFLLVLHIGSCFFRTFTYDQTFF